MKTKPRVAPVAALAVASRFARTIGMIICLAAGLVTASRSAAAEGAGGMRIETLAWLAGTWTMERSGRVVTERWTAPSGGMMLGTSQTVRDGKTTEYEFLVIRVEAAGGLVYVAKPSNQPEATFKAVRAGENAVMFENAAHDFPQRISYTRQADGSLLAAIEGERGGKTRRVEFHYRAAR